MSPRHSRRPLNRPLSSVLYRPLQVDRPLQAILRACSLCLSLSLGAAALAVTPTLAATPALPAAPTLAATPTLPAAPAGSTPPVTLVTPAALTATTARTRAIGHRASHHHLVCHTRGTHERRACARVARVRDERRHRHHATTPRTAAPTPAQSEANNAAVIASVLAGTCQNTTLTPEADNLPEIDAATVCLVNQERARNDELPLRLNADLQEAANEHSQEMVEKDYFAHVSPSGMTPLERVQATGYIPSPQDGYTIGENIAWGTLELSTPQAIVKAWIASPEHLANMLESHYTDTAIGVAPAAPPSLANGQQGAVYSQEFGVIVQ